MTLDHGLGLFQFKTNWLIVLNHTQQMLILQLYPIGSTNVLSIKKPLNRGNLFRKKFSSKLVKRKIHLIHYVAIDKSIRLYFLSHVISNKSCDLFK